jgi:hypothetical protein
MKTHQGKTYLAKNAQLSELKDADRGPMTPREAPGCRSMEPMNQNLQGVRSRKPARGSHLSIQYLYGG